MKGLIIFFILLIATPVFAQDCNVEVIKQTPIVYPDSAKAKGIEGTVYVQAWIGTNGFVKVVNVIKSDNSLLNDAAMDSVLKWQFKPLMKECKVTIPIKFKLAS